MRRIVPGDLTDPRVIELVTRHFATARAQTPPESAHAIDVAGLQAPGISFWCLWDGEMLLGTGALKRLSADHGEVKTMHTRETARRQSVASALLQHLIDEARSDGMSRLSLETGSSDYFRPGRELYRRHGFGECLPFADYMLDSHSVYMTLDLNGTSP